MSELRALAAETYGFAERGRTTLDRVCDAWGAWKSGSGGSVDAEVANDFGRDLIAQAFFDLHRAEMDTPDFARFAAAINAAAPGSTASSLLASFAAELGNDAAGTKRHLDAVLAVEPNHGTALLRSMIVAIDQSRYDDALAFNGRLFGGDHEQAGPLPLFAAALRTAGRNDPCPCGSGRKYKHCHMGMPLLVEPAATHSLTFKVNRYTDDRAYADQFGLEHAAASGVLELIDDPALRDLVIHEGGFLSRYLSDRGSFLPADETARLRRWAELPRELHQVVDVSPDLRLTMRNVHSGHEFEMREAIGAGDVFVGEHRWMRLEEHNGERLPVGVIFTVADAQVADVQQMIETDAATLDAMVDWLKDA